MIIKRLEHLSYEKNVRSFALLSLEKTQGDLIKMYKYLMGSNKGKRAQLFSVVVSEWTKGN